MKKTWGLMFGCLVASSLSAGSAFADPVKTTLLGTTSFDSAAKAAAARGPSADQEDIREKGRENDYRQALRNFAADRRAKMSEAGLAAAKATAPTTIPHLNGLGIAEKNHGASGFLGISNYSQAAVNQGFSVEPPDQALAVGNGFVLEGVNSALALYSEHGNLVAGPVGNNDFFQSALNVSDPRCMFDSASNRWFITVTIYNDSFTSNSIAIAVSQTGDPKGLFNLYSIDVTNDGDFGPCPCFGDQPLIGYNRNVFVVTTNAFDNFNFFEGAQVYALSKKALAAGLPSPVVHFGNLSNSLPGVEFAFSLQPSVPAPDDPAEKGTEYLVQALGGLPIEAGVGVWALSDTTTIDTTQSLGLKVTIVPSQAYAGPQPATQKAGPTPLGEQAAAGLVLGGVLFPGDSSEQRLDGNDVRMQQVMFSGGRLYTSLGTAAVTPGSPVIDAAAWFAIDVKNSSSGPQAKVAKQGYVAGPNGSSVVYPAVAVNASGQAAMVFTLTGPTFFPSAAYALLGGGSIHILEDGAAPEDGFSAYYFARPRWGDYSAATVGPDGSLWLATELIPGGPRKRVANWGTFIARLVGGDD